MPDVDGFSAFVRASQRSLLRTAWLLTGDWGSAEDLVQTALTKTWQRWDRIDPDAAHGYVRKVMLTSFLGWRARRWTGEVALGWVPDRQTDAPDSDTRQAVLTVLRGLPRQQRAVVVLRYFDDLTERATADALGCSVGTVKSHTARALAALRAIPELADLTNERTS